MGAPTVDVRDMLCAQALAVVGHATESLKVGETLDILYNAEDVQRDLLVWAKDRGYDARPASERLLKLWRTR